MSTHENPSDILTKHVGREWLDKVCKMCHMRFPGEDESEVRVGRSAPTEREEEDDPEADEWGSRFEEAASALTKWYGG